MLVAAPAPPPPPRVLPAALGVCGGPLEHSTHQSHPVDVEMGSMRPTVQRVQPMSRGGVNLELSAGEESFGRPVLLSGTVEKGRSSVGDGRCEESAGSVAGVVANSSGSKAGSERPADSHAKTASSKSEELDLGAGWGANMQKLDKLGSEVVEEEPGACQGTVRGVVRLLRKRLWNVPALGVACLLHVLMLAPWTLGWLGGDSECQTRAAWIFRYVYFDTVMEFTGNIPLGLALDLSMPYACGMALVQAAAKLGMNAAIELLFPAAPIMDGRVFLLKGAARIFLQVAIPWLVAGRAGVRRASLWLTESIFFYCVFWPVIIVASTYLSPFAYASVHPFIVGGAEGLYLMVIDNLHVVRSRQISVDVEYIVAARGVAAFQAARLAQQMSLTEGDMMLANAAFSVIADAVLRCGGLHRLLRPIRRWVTGKDRTVEQSIGRFERQVLHAKFMHEHVPALTAGIQIVTNTPLFLVSVCEPGYASYIRGWILFWAAGVECATDMMTLLLSRTVCPEARRLATHVKFNSWSKLVLCFLGSVSASALGWEVFMMVFLWTGELQQDMGAS